MASLILTGVFGTGGSSWGRGRRKDLDGVWGVDLVRARAGEAMLDEGFSGDAARERDVGGNRTFGFDGLRDIVFGIQEQHVLLWLAVEKLFAISYLVPAPTPSLSSTSCKYGAFTSTIATRHEYVEILCLDKLMS
jgi:hypothetical protein